MSNCLNCNHEIDLQDKFCSNCGQKVDSNDLRLSVVLRDFFENYISLDTQFGRSIMPFLFKPGFLTKKFILGIRKNFANPFRLYILTSVLFFSALSFWFISQKENGESPIKISSIDQALNSNYAQLKHFDSLDSLTYQLLNDKIGDDLKQKFNRFKKEEFIDGFNSISKLNQKRVGLIIPDSIQEKLRIPSDSILNQNNKKFSINLDKENSGFNLDLDEIDFDIVRKERLNPAFSDENLLNSLEIGELSEFYRFICLRVIHIYRADSKSFTSFVIKNLSIMMLFVLPVSALILLIVFYKSKMKYVEHLIHSIHLHAFSYFFMGMIYILLYFINDYGIKLDSFRPIFIFILFLHFVVSLKKVYSRSWIKTIFKTFLSLFIYNIIVVFFLLLEFSVSFFLY
jgi:hypothetical protein